ncbi:TPA: hypothetical protein VBE27_001258 [Streptococcus agalactiae]|uniref:hypothetical protein n=2 Tax=Streptococcus agalactiae TaxID=1311 RepID=UPI0002BC0CA3|nr:hypothetical protein [Streptococcus agalactiae]OIX63551.1 hypothetical protein A9240_04370 [Streptococcus agalactiae serogroup III]CDN67417.1 hypothetical protein GBSCOH1_1951 [Streptococcus agalactiae COH1]AWZ37202.1 hypothetical protein CCZ24_10925 [Streptococcus agalactiae]EPT77762.1 hypothetical protein SAG0084_06550 [Streptococcus agalactiae LMG 15085]EPT81129.1 hypothetical protein SAG0091_04480 [Streptococcus agalactiae LMG 15095]
MRTLFQSTQKTERECAFCVLKNQDNMIKKKRNPRVLFRNVAYKLSEIEGKTLTETASFLGFGNSEVCRSALYKWKRKKWLKFDLKNGHYRNVEVLHEVTLEKMANKELKEQGLIYKANIYYEQVVSTSEIIEDIKTKTQDRIKAIHLQQQALERIPSELFAELYTNMN